MRAVFKHIRTTIGLAAVILSAGVFSANATEAGWALLRSGGHTVLIRHAMTMGGANDALVDPNDCSTQNRLTEQGKLQARRMGALFATRAAPIERIVSSEYCAAVETARSAFPYEELEINTAFDSLDESAPDERQIATMKQTLAASPRSGNAIFITHLSNIRSLTGQSAREGEAVIVEGDGESMRVLGKIIFR
ncbi:histidine phosphatase family protein [Limoniibacter endophyticus]|nr:histidine phosphatase family protein [Limoniibacter endophyticus]